MEGLELHSEDRNVIPDEFVHIEDTPFKEAAKVAFPRDKERRTIAAF
jgi:hypothetical protein